MALGEVLQVDWRIDAALYPAARPSDHDVATAPTTVAPEMPSPLADRTMIAMVQHDVEPGDTSAGDHDAAPAGWGDLAVPADPEDEDNAEDVGAESVLTDGWTAVLGEDDQDDEDEDEDDEDSDGWADLAELADDWCHIWVDGSEQAWFRYAWRALGRAGLVGYNDDVERCHVVARLAALACLYKGFQARAHEEGHPADWIDNGIYLVGKHPLCPAFSLGQLCERLDLGIVADEGELDRPDDVPRETMQALIRAAAPEVASALVAELGDNFVFASLYASRSAGVRFPLSSRRYHAAVNEDINGAKSHAWAWVSDGMDLDNY